MNDYFKEVLKAKKKLELIEKKFNNNKALTLEELESLFLFYQVENNVSALADKRFDYVRFRQLYLIYSIDLEFKSIFYKRNPNKKVSDYVDFRKLRELNEKEYDPKTHRELVDYKINNQIIIPVDKQEVEKDKLLLEKYAKDWALVCLNERHSDERLKDMAKEGRDTLNKKNIEGYLNNTLTEDSKKDVFRGLLKLYYVHHEAIKIIEIIDSKNEQRLFTLNGVNFEINHYSFIHIINRHYAEILSSQGIITTKSFHNSKIDPYKIHLFIKDLIFLIKAKGIENKILVQKGQALIIKFNGIDYALFFSEYKHDKSKVILETFFIIESDNPNARRLIERIDDSQIITLNDDLSIYI